MKERKEIEIERTYLEVDRRRSEEENKTKTRRQKDQHYVTIEFKTKHLRSVGCLLKLKMRWVSDVLCE